MWERQFNISRIIFGIFPLLLLLGGGTSLLRRGCGRNTSWRQSPVFFVFFTEVFETRRLLREKFVSCVFIEVRDPSALTGSPWGRLSSPPNQKTNRSRSFCALYTNALTIKCIYNHTPPHPPPPLKERWKEERQQEGVKSRFRGKAFSNSLPVDILACTFGSAGTADNPNPADFLPKGLSDCLHCCYFFVPGDKKNSLPTITPNHSPPPWGCYGLGSRPITVPVKVDLLRAKVSFFHPLTCRIWRERSLAKGEREGKNSDRKA